MFVARAPSNAVQGVFTLNNTKFHGVSATLYESGRLEMVAFYANGKLNGPMRIWTGQKERLLYAEYRNDNKHGLVCLFSKQLPWLVQEWDNAMLKHEHLVKYVGKLPEVLPSSDLAGATAEEFALAKDKLTELEQKMQDDENKFRRGLVDWIRKEGRKHKQHRNSQRTPVPGLEIEWRKALKHSKN